MKTSIIDLSSCQFAPVLRMFSGCSAQPCRPAGGDAHPGALPAAGGPAAEAAGGAAAQDHLLLRLPLRVWQRAAAGLGRAGGRRRARLRPAARFVLYLFVKFATGTGLLPHVGWFTLYSKLEHLTQCALRPLAVVHRKLDRSVCGHPAAFSMARSYSFSSVGSIASTVV